MHNQSHLLNFRFVPDYVYQIIRVGHQPRVLLGMRKPEDRDPELVGAAMGNIERALDNIAHFVDDGAGPWAIGGKVSIADCALVPVLNVVSVLAMVYQRDDLFAARPRLDAYWQAARTDPVNARVIGEQLAALPQ